MIYYYYLFIYLLSLIMIYIYIFFIIYYYLCTTSSRPSQTYQHFSSFTVIAIPAKAGKLVYNT